MHLSTFVPPPPPHPTLTLLVAKCTELVDRWHSACHWLHPCIDECVLVCGCMQVLVILSLQTGAIALHCAAQEGYIDVVNALVKAGSKVNEKDEVIV